MIAYLYKWITRQMLNADPEAGKTISAQLMQKIYQAFTDESGKKKNLFSYQLHEEKNSDVRRICIMDHLRFEDGILFGSIGIMTDEVDGMIRERDIVTFEESKITPSGPNKKFEYFTFFSIYPGKEHFLILKNGNMPSYIDNIITIICFQALEGDPYEFRIETYQEKTMRERVRELKKSRVEMRIELSDLDFAFKPGIRQLRKKADKKGALYVTLGIGFESRLENADIDELVTLVDDGDIKRLVVRDADAPAKDADAIDLLKDVMKSKRDINIKKNELTNYGLVWEKFKDVMLSLSTNDSTQ